MAQGMVFDKLKIIIHLDMIFMNLKINIGWSMTDLFGKNPLCKGSACAIKQNSFYYLGILYYDTFQNIISKSDILEISFSWISVFPRTLNICREHTTKYSH